jgi:creatinine amidohydrolase
MTTSETRWARLRPDQLRARMENLPLVYIPYGLCEPHGHIAPFGLDTLKADYYCDQAARRFGGVVAPTQAYHIHETGFHQPWLDEVVGDEQAYLGGMPPEPVCYHFLYQLRAFANAGFRAVIGVSGHSGGSQVDLRLVAEVFSRHTGIPVLFMSDPEFVEGQYEGDHAGKYEISQLLAIEPDLVDMSLLQRGQEANSGGRLALGEDAAEATAEHGKQINEAIITAIGNKVSGLAMPPESPERITIEDAEQIWQNICTDPRAWHSCDS